MRVTIAAREDNPQWQGWSVESDGQTPWEGAQVAAFEVLSEICQEFGDELVNGPIESFPRVDASQTVWAQQGGNALVRDRDERARSSNAAMSAMYVVMRMFYSRQDSYINCMLELQRAQAAQRRMRACVRRHRRAVRAAQHEIDNFTIAIAAHQR